MKQTIAKKLTKKLAVIMVSVFLLLILCSYITVSRIVLNETQHYTSSIVNIYADSVSYDAEGMHFPIDETNTDSITVYGEYICQWYRIDYSYAYKVIPDKNQMMLLGFFKKDGINFSSSTPEDIIGKTVDYTPSESESQLWDGKTQVIHIRNNQFENATDSRILVTDSFGNKVVFGVGMSLDSINATSAKEFSKILVIIIVAFVFLTAIMYFIIRKCVFDPAKCISESMTAFISDGKRSDVRLDEKGEDEFAMIAKAFNSMTDNIDEYLSNIKNLTIAQERNNTELNIASSIQQGFLPGKEYNAGNYLIQAMMKPAKDVGGDLYDYLPLDDGRVFITVGDVSGKGMSASMYMAVALVLMRQFARMGYTPAEILKNTNNVISERNSSMLFITSFVAIYDPSTKKLTYSNAGHNPPYVIRKKPELLDENINLLLGIYSSEDYEQSEIQLENGDIVLLYTDGVTEAHNSEGQFYGDSRLEELLSGFRETHDDNLVRYVSNSVNDFASDTEQHDDMTILALTVGDYVELELDIDTSEFSKISKVILSSEFERSEQLNLCVIAEEIFTNICLYAFPDGVPEGEKIKFSFECSDRIVMQFEDNGIKFNPTEDVFDAEDYDPDEQIGGLGRFIAFTVADEFKYEYLNSKNILKIVKYIKEA